MTARYRVKTIRGYYFTESNGRYARYYGDEKRGEILCQKHADEQVDFLQTHMPDYWPERVLFMGHAPCAVCKRRGNK